MIDKQVMIFLVVGALAMLARVVITMEKFFLYGIIRTLSTGAFVGVIVGLGLLDSISLENWQKYLALGVAVALSEDLMIALVAFGKEIKDDPRAFIERFIRKNDKPN